jgi:SAM-dependent methyltransferase
MRRFYDPESGWIDGTEEFHRMCADAIRRGGRILEIGAGPSNSTSSFLATLGELHGIDPDPDVRNNGALVSADVLDGDRYPYRDASFDACVSNYVLEHITDANAHMREVARVLRPGGSYVFRTPNRFHYVAMVSAMTPHWFHVKVANKLRDLPEDAHDPYPTVHALNTRHAIKRHASATGLRVVALRMVEKEPSYGKASRALFLAFLAYERFVNATELAAALRANIFGVLRKPH